MKPPLSSKTADPSAYRALYGALPESLKKALTVELQKKDHWLFRAWLRAAHLLEGGHRAPFVAQRRVTRHAQMLDKALFESSADLMLDVLRFFFHVVKLRPSSRYASFVRKRAEKTAWSDPACLDEFLENLVSCDEIEDEAVLNLWRQLAAESHLDGLLDAISRACAPASQPGANTNESSSDQTSPVMAGHKRLFWEHSLRTLLDETAASEKVLARLGGAQRVEEDEMACFTNLRDQAESLRALLDAEAANLETATPQWRGIEELRTLMDEMMAHPRFDPEPRRPARGFYRELADEIAALQVEHRLPRRREELKNACTAAVEKLAAVSEGEDDPALLPGAEERDAREWLEWCLGLHGEELEQHCDALQKGGLDALASLLGEADASWLTNAEDEADDDDHDDAKDYDQASPPDSQRDATSDDTGETASAETMAVSDQETAPSTPASSNHSASKPTPLTVVQPDIPKETPPANPSPPTSAESQPTPPTALPAPTLPRPAQDKTKANVLSAPPQSDISQPITAALEKPAQAWSLQPSLAVTAQALSGVGDEMDESKLARLAWLALAEGEFEIAWWLSREAGADAPSADLVEMLALSLSCAGQSPSCSARFDALMEVPPVPGSDLLSFAALLLPSLLEPSTPAWERLEKLGLGSWPALRDAARIVAKFGGLHIALTPELLSATQGAAALQSRRAALHEQIKSWWERAPGMGIISLPARDVWRGWLSNEGWLGRLVRPVISNEAVDVKVLLDVVREHSSVEILSDLADRDYARRHRGSLIVDARKQIVSRTLIGLQWVAEWLRMDMAQPRENDFRERAVRELRQQLDAILPRCLEELEAAQQPDVRVKGGVTAGREILQRVRAMLDGADTGGRAAWEPPAILGAPLLRFDGVELDEAWQPRAVTAAQPLRAALVRSLASSPRPWQQAARNHHQRGDFLSLRRCVEMFGHQDRETAEALEKLRDNDFKAQQAAVERLVNAAREQLADALRQGLYTEGDYNGVEARLNKMEQESRAGGERFHDLRLRAEAVSAEIHTRCDQRKEAARTRLEALRSREISTDVLKRIEDAIGEDVIAGIDFLERAERGESLPEPDTDVAPPLELFFDAHRQGGTSAFARITKYLLEGTPRVHELMRAIREARELCGLPLHEVPKPQREDAARLMETWLHVKQRGTINAEEAATILTHLGFHNVTAEVRASGGRTWVQARTAPVTDRALCPLPAWGSEAGGGYRVLCVWNRPAVVDLINAIDRNVPGACLIFYFGCLAGRSSLEQPRRDLARLALERHKKCLLIDDALALFLCAGATPRLPSFVRCAAPFSACEPYTSAAGQVPPEMFYGREWEMEQILSPDGSSFLFGGRQLGKTVLLRTAEKHFHHPAAGRIARWIDLKDKGIGSSQHADKLWEVLGAELKTLGVLPPGFKPTSRDSDCLRLAEEWLEAQPDGRRILLLLDEADDFLNADGADKEQEFARCSLLKGVMDRTRRRFKVVFAGLHNVQRSTRSANQPLAHFGEPICIGPMLRGAEAVAAADLVRSPLQACGYFFDPDHEARLVTHILAQTNYYPSLIQLFCQKLLQFCNQNGRSRFDPRTTPPWRICPSHVKEAEKSDTLRHAIRDKFILTLDLDKRFRLIAFLMAYYEGGNSAGFLASEIARMAREWWPKGFEQHKSDDVFRDLLEEMVGLGVLRRDSVTGHFALRSPNLVTLLGTPAELETELLSCSKWESEPEYAPQHFHQTLDDHGHQRSPFTAQQEKRLFGDRNGVFVIIGCALGGMGHKFHERLRLLARRESFDLVEARDERSFAAALDGLSKRAGDRLVISVSDQWDWEAKHVLQARAHLRKLRSGHSFVSVLFSQASARVVALDDPDAAANVERLSLGPWHDSALRQWFERLSIGPHDAEGRARVRDATGFWPELMDELFERLHKQETWEQAVTQMTEAQVRDPAEQTRILALASQHFSPPPPLLKVIAEYGPDGITLADAIALAETDKESAETLLSSLDQLQLVTRTEHRVSLDPVIARCLKGLHPA